MGWRNTAITTEKLKSSINHTLYQHTFCIDFYWSHSLGTVRYRQNTRTLCALPCFWCAYCSIAIFLDPGQDSEGIQAHLSFLSLHIISSKFGISSCYSSHFFLSLLLSKDKLWKIPEINNEKNPLL